ncbi:MAG TPA: hypothetical protein VHS09_07010 [Polyangiaceae bacterium]|jgi:hypothetical protein|nr:hypothetical protein [Polyangiaceae bacterium]
MASRLAWSGAAVLASLLAASAAQAAPTAADRETARTLMDQGRDLRDKGDLKEALKRFKAADDIMHVPTTALPLAKAQAALGLLVEARDTLAVSMRRTPEKPGDPQPFKDARVEGERLDASLASRVPALTITVKGAAEGQPPTLSVDDVDVPAAAMALPREVDPGHHVLVAKTATAVGRQEVDVKEGEQKPVEVTLVATGAPAPTETPVPTPPETPVTTTTTSHSPTALTWVGIGLAGAGAVAGTVTGVLSMSKKSALAGECTNAVCGPSSHSDYDSAHTLALVSTIGFIAAGVGAGVAVVTLLVGHGQASEPAEQPPSARLVVRPWIGPGAGGVSGSF